jgi:hypothetical protein
MTTRNARYEQSPKGKAAQKRYRQSDKGKARQAKYARSAKGEEAKAKANARYRANKRAAPL